MINYKNILNDLKNQGFLRILPEEKGYYLYDFTSNDYLGLAKYGNSFDEEFFDSFPDLDFSLSASRLLADYNPVYAELENYLSSLYGRPALLFNSGYHANTGIISALSGMKATLMVCDKDVHASIIDGLLIGRAAFKRFRHNDIQHLTDIIEAENGNYDNIIIVAESIYSMSGDTAPLEDFVSLKRRYPNVSIYLDEAHAFGVRGAKGLGLAEEKKLLKDIDIIVATFGKAAASVGAFVISSKDARDFFINKARGLIYSTGLPPVNIARSLFMTQKIVKMKKERKQLAQTAADFKKRIEEITGNHNSSESQIIPLVTGDPISALKMADILCNKFMLYVKAVRRPTVAPGKDGLRFSIHYDLRTPDVENKFLNLVGNIIADAYSEAMKSESLQ